MDVPLELSFKNLDVSEAVEARVREKVARLDRIFDRLVACRVSIEFPHRQHQKGNKPHVRIEMSVPGDSLTVSHAPHHLEERYREWDVHTVVNEAFAAAEKQLKSYKARMKGEVKRHDEPLTGRITDLRPQQDYGFLDSATGSQLWFHRNAVTDEDFDGLSIGDSVHYVETVGANGPQASKVWRANPVGRNDAA